MIKRHLALAICIGCLTTVLAAPYAYAQERYPILAPCTRDDPRYAALFFNTEHFDDWAEKYHEAVDEVVEEYLEPPGDIQCDEDILLPIDGATSAMGAMAQKLPPWQDPTDRAKLKRSDVGIVLLEHLRLYECALSEHYYYLPVDVIQEKFLDFSGGTFPLPKFVPGFDLLELIAEMERRREIIRNEIVIARPTLERALLLLNALTRLMPLDAELQCLQRPHPEIPPSSLPAFCQTYAPH